MGSGERERSGRGSEKGAAVMSWFQNWYEALSDEALVREINSLGYWDGDLLKELVGRAFPGHPDDWECGDQVCYDAAAELGFELD